MKQRNNGFLFGVMRFSVYFCSMKTAIRSFCCLLAILLTACSTLVSCDRLDDSDGDVVSRVLPGKWSFSYIINGDEDPGLNLQYKHVIFEEDGTCAITYIDNYDIQYDEEGNIKVDAYGNPVLVPIYAALHGTYQATNTMIRIVSSDIDNEERVLLWRILSLSEQQVVAEYDFDMNGSSLTAVVTLDRQ